MTWNTPRSHLESTPSVASGEVSGKDTTGRLEIVMDGAGQVARVTVPRLEPDDSLRETDPLLRALVEAWNAAEGARLQVVLADHPERERLERLGEDLLAGRYRVTLPEPPPVPEPDFSRREASAVGLALLEGRWTPEGELDAPHDVVGSVVDLRIVLSRSGVPDRLFVDADWIAQVSAAGLSGALTRALADSRPTDSRTTRSRTTPSRTTRSRTTQEVDR